MLLVSKWIDEGSKINDFSMIYKNGTIETFLNDPEKHFIISGKGIGKTVLLRYKRHQMEKKVSGVLFLPSDQSHVGFVENLTETLSSIQTTQFSSVEFCENFWRLAIQIYLLSNSSISESALTELKEDVSLIASSSINLNNDFVFLLKNGRGIHTVCNHFMSMGYNKLQELFRISYLISDFLKKNIQKPIYYFFDRFDQALKYSNDEIWYSMQQGLLEATWSIMKNNSDIKIYLSLRQEAYDAHSSINKQSMAANVSLISYTSKELKELIEGLVKFYEGKNSLEDFLGIDKFNNTVTHDDEDIYQFMNRYSLGRPRDFIVFCGKLSEIVGYKFNSVEERANQLKNSIITSSASSIISSLHDEVCMLLKCLYTKEKFENFVKLFSHNILTFEELQNCCNKYNDLNCSKKCSTCKKDSPEKKHPFCDLYIMGLLGKIKRRDVNSELRQVFKSPYEDITKAGIYGDSEGYYLIHPALRYYITQLKNESGSTYELYNCLLIGDDLPWTEKDVIVTKINKNIDKIKKQNVKKFLNDQLIYFSKEENAIKSYSDLTTEYKSIKTHVTQRDSRIVGDVLRLLSSDKDKKISIFISYAYESDEHKERIISFTNKLQRMGFNATMDEFLKRDHPNIDEMMTEGLKCEKVIIILSEKYKEKADNNKGGVWKEFKMIANDLEINYKKYIFVSFNSFSDDPPERISPIRLGNHFIIYLEKGKKNKFNELISYITDVSIYPLIDVSNNTRKVIKKRIKDF
jgi:hypothetical protein